MKSRLVVAGAIAAIALGVAQSAHALNANLIPCQEAIAKGAGKFVAKKMKAVQKCNNSNLKTAPTVSCAPATLATTVSDLKTKMNTLIDKKCALLTPTQLGTAGIGFPGRCDDPNPGDGFTETDLDNCMYDTHEAAVDTLINTQYGTTINSPASPLPSTQQKCQETIAKDGAKVLNAVVKAVQKCRNNLNKGKLFGFLPRDCATADPKTSEKIGKAVSKATADITNPSKCMDADVLALDICGGTATTAAQAASCITSSHQLAADDPAPTSNDLLDIEYATAPTCGDGIINTLDEECDLSDVSGCVALGFSGPCGAPGSNFACLCLDIPRERVIEHANADLDNGWTGQSHDSGVVEGGGYVADLYDCDNISDFLCNVGPSCSGGAHSPCQNDAQCAALSQGTCRKRSTAVGPHCALNVQQTCPAVNGNASCPGTGNFCKTSFHGPPLPLSSGGIPVCIANVFTQDVTGTRNLTTGDSSVLIRQDSIIRAGIAANQPCPTCGDFCNWPGTTAGDDANRKPCVTNADCADLPPLGTITCNHSAMCSGGFRRLQECRPDPPFGGPTALFGTTSVDCPADASFYAGASGLDIFFNPATTGTVTVSPPTFVCDAPAFSNTRCAGGSNSGQLCTTASQCPGGSCSPQCFCPGGGGVQEQPNDCDPACVGGTSNGGPCGADSDCPSGFCHPADCRPDPTQRCFNGPNDGTVCTNNSECPGGSCPAPSPYEGGCTTSVQGICSASRFRTCTADSDCEPPICPFCDPSETCVVTPKNCFINDSITRAGLPHPTDPISAAFFCIPSTSAPSVNSTAGLPGPGSILQPATVVDTGL